jgi:hypothetical protein
MSDKKKAAYDRNGRLMKPPKVYVIMLRLNPDQYQRYRDGGGGTGLKSMYDAQTKVQL